MHDLTLKEIQKEYPGSYKAYFLGFIFSLILTLISFGLVMTKTLSGRALIFSLSGLALTQAIVQLLFFLHVGKESKPYWETIICIFMIAVLLIISFGSLWIMYDLNNRMMMEM